MKRRSVSTCRTSPKRRGAAMVYVMVLLLVISMIGAALVRTAILQHRQRLRDEIRAQTVRLAEAGWERAARSAALDENYAGETWRLDETALGKDRRAEVRLDVLPAEGDAPRRRLRIVADYPAGSPLSTRCTLEGTVMLMKRGALPD
jgi:hypothetical protein